MAKRLTEEQTLEMERDMFDKAQAEKQADAAEPEAPPAETAVEPDPLQTAVEQEKKLGEELMTGLLSKSISQEMKDGFVIEDRAAETTITVTMEDARAFIVNKSASGNVPSDRELVRYIKLCQADGYNPFTDDVYLLGYDNKDYKSGKVTSTTWQRIVSHAALMKRAQKHPAFDGMESGVTVWDRLNNQKIDIEGDVYYKGDVDEQGKEQYALIGGWCRIHRKDRSVPIYATARLSSYKKVKAVWENGRKTNKVEPQGYWATDEPWMICKCAQSKGIRHSFPNQVGSGITDAERDWVTNAEHSNGEAATAEEPNATDEL